MRITSVARASSPLSREHPAPGAAAGKMPTPQKLGKNQNNLSQRRQAAKAAKHKFPVFFATSAAWRLCENMFSHFGRFFHTFPAGGTPALRRHLSL